MPKRFMAKGLLLLALALPLVVSVVIGASSAAHSAHHADPRLACASVPPPCW